MKQDNVQESVEELVKVDIAVVDSTLKRNEEYEEKKNNDNDIDKYIHILKPSANIQQLNKEIEYIGQLSIPKCNYVGYLTRNLKRIYYGYNLYDNSTLNSDNKKNQYYYGQWDMINDTDTEKHGFGIYHYTVDSIPDIVSEYYIGNWDKGCKQGNGIYIWIKDNNAFDCIIGTFGNNNNKEVLLKGIKVELYKDYNNQTTFTVYICNMDDNGVKNDDNAIMIENNNIFNGKILNDNIIQGRFVNLNKTTNNIEKSYNIIPLDPNSTKLGNYTFNADLDINKDNKMIQAKKDIDQEELDKKISNIIQLLENIDNNKDNIDYYKTGNFSLEEKLKNSINEIVDIQAGIYTKYYEELKK